jgi:disulfide bond formation protein DsbB
MHLAHTRSLFFLVFIACAMIIGAVVYLQRVFGLSPCVMCLWQRAGIIVCGLLALIAALHAPGRGGCRAYSVVILMMALVGAAIAGGQVWLQTATTDQTIDVIAWIERLLDLLSLQTLIDRLLSDAALCAEISWTLFGISLPEWSLLAFVGVTLIMLYALFRSCGSTLIAESRAGD